MRKITLFVLFFLLINQSTVVYSQHNKPISIYQKGWIDFNKNNLKDIYEDPSQPIEKRVKNLLQQMTIDEKTGQLLTTLGWKMYDRVGNDVKITELLKNKVQNEHIGSLWGFLRADPWTKRTLVTGLNPVLAVKATNQMQQWVIQNSRLGIPLLLHEEAPHGHMAIGTTVFPTSIGLSSTWNPDLINGMAKAVALEIRKQGAHIAYGPVLDLLRDPRWSRTEECFGEDPFLISCFGEAYVKGLQGTNLKSGINVVSTLKHLTGHGWPEGGHNAGSVHIGEFDLNEFFYPPFKAAVKAGALSIMSSYNEIDGTPCTGNRQMLTETLRNDWGFKGFVISDLEAIEGLIVHGVAANKSDAALKAINAGVDADLGGEAFKNNLVDLVKSGKLSESVLNTAVKRILDIKFQLGLFDTPFNTENQNLTTQELLQHRQLARKIAKESIILLKNDSSILPLSKNISSLAVIGPNADNVYNMLGDYTAPQVENEVATVLRGIKNRVSPNTKILYAKGCSIRGESEEGFSEALNAARRSDVVVLVMGGSSARDFSSHFETTGAAKVSESKKSDMESGEGYDRSTLNMMGKQEKLISEIAKLNKPIVLVMIQGRPLNLNLATKSCSAILNAWYPGIEGGNAIADVLFGDYNPAGRLTISIPRSEGQLPVFYNTNRLGNRKNYIDQLATPLFSFGYGLSYSRFDYSGFELNFDSINNKTLTVKIIVKNAGKSDGDEVIQLYMRQKVTSHTTPERKLIAFKRINIKQGESKAVLFEIEKSQLEIYQGQGKWNFEPGEFRFMVGKSSDNIVYQKDIYIQN